MVSDGLSLWPDYGWLFNLIGTLMVCFFTIKIYGGIDLLLLLLIVYSELGWGSWRILTLWNNVLLFWWRLETASAAEIFINLLNLNVYFAYLFDLLIMMYSILFLELCRSWHFLLLFIFFFTFVIARREIYVVLMRVVRHLKLLRSLNSHSSHVFVKSYCWWGICNNFIIRGRIIDILILFDVIRGSLLQRPCHCTISIRYRLFSWSFLRWLILIIAVFLGKLTINKLLCLYFFSWWLIPIFLLGISV